MATNILLIDYSSILHATWHAESANPDPNATSTKVVARVRALASGKPHVAICCEGKGSFRKALDPTYKAQRPEPIAELHHQGDVALDVLRADGFPVWSADGYEADDVIATAVYARSGDAYPITIASADKDLLQLVGPRVTVHSLTSGNDIDTDGVMAKFGVAPHQMVDYLSLVGDTSDNIKGAKGIGAKGAAKLLAAFGNLDDLFSAIEMTGDLEECPPGITPSMLASLKEFAIRAKTVRELITLKTDAPIPFEEIFKPRQPVVSDDAVFDGTDAQITADIEETMQPLNADYRNGPDTLTVGQPLTLLEAQEQPTRGALLTEAFHATKDSQHGTDTAHRSIGSDDAAKVVRGDTLSREARPRHQDAAAVSVSGGNGEVRRDRSDGSDSRQLQDKVTSQVMTPDVLAPAPIEWERQLEPRSLRECETLAKAVMASRLNFGTYGSHFAVMSTVLAGRELGLQAMASLRAFHIIDNKPTLSAGVIVAMVLKSGIAEYFRCTKRTPEKATFVTKRHGDPELALTFTIEEAKQAWTKDAKAWGNSGWGRNPADMCVARASSKLARLVYPDVVFNLYSPEEFDE